MSEIQAQCWICPRCFDDKHHEPGDERCIANNKAWERLDDPAKIRDSFESDQLAEDELAAKLPSDLWQAPDGEYFEVVRRFACGTVVTCTGKWLSPEELGKCTEVTCA